MIKKYFLLFFLTIFIAVGSLQAQEPKGKTVVSTEDLNFYPNPVSNGKIFITSKNPSAKEIAIFDVLGKKVLQINLNVNIREVNVMSLNSGVYIIKIQEGNTNVTRKLIIK